MAAAPVNQMNDNEDHSGMELRGTTAPKVIISSPFQVFTRSLSVVQSGGKEKARNKHGYSINRCEGRRKREPPSLNVRYFPQPEDKSCRITKRKER